MWRAAMQIHLKKSQQNVESTLASKEQTPTEATPTSIEIVLNSTRVGTEEPTSIEPTTPHNISSPESDQPLRPRKRFWCLKRGFRPSSSQLSSSWLSLIPNPSSTILISLDSPRTPPVHLSNLPPRLTHPINTSSPTDSLKSSSHLSSSSLSKDPQPLSQYPCYNFSREYF